jgi:hypothetical protein
MRTERPRTASAMSVVGTFETSGDVRLESAFRGKAEDMGSQRVFRLLTPSGPAPTIPMRLFSAPLLGQALGARLLLVG